MSKFTQLLAASALAAVAFLSNVALASDAPDFSSPQFVGTKLVTGNGDVMVMGDFNGDGIPDVAILGTTYGATDTNFTDPIGSVEVHFGNGTGGFSNAVANFSISTGIFYEGIAAGNIDGDGKSELVIAGGNAVLVYTWNGTSFSQDHSIDLTGTGIDMFEDGYDSFDIVAVGHLAATNSQDIVLTDLFGDVGIVCLTNDGHGNFGPPSVFPIGGGVGGAYAAPSSTVFRPLLLANLNGQNKLDDVILSWGDSSTNTPGAGAGSTEGVFLNNGDGTLSSEVSYGNSTLAGLANSLLAAGSVAVADVDGDGKLDLVSMCSTFNTKTGAGLVYLSVSLGNGDGTFQDAKAFYLGGQGGSAIDAADFNGDGRVDIVTTDGSDDAGLFTITEWSGTGPSLAIARQDYFYADSHYYNSVVLGYQNSNGTFVTFNNDKKVDVLMGTPESFYDANSNVVSHFALFQNDTVVTPPTLLPTTLNILGGTTKPIAPGAPILFYATNLSTAPGLYVRVQSTSTTNSEGSWTNLPDGHGGQMSFTPLPKIPGIYSFGLAGTVYYPAGSAVYFRAITAALGYTDSISPPIGPFALEQAQLTINAKLTSTTDPTGTLQTTHIGDVLTCTLIWTNIGQATATGLEVTTPVPSYHELSDNAFVQFPSNQLSFNSYGKYVAESRAGANDAKVVWKVSALKPGYSQAEVLAIQIGPAVLTNQFIDIPDDYSVMSTNGSPPTGATGFSSGSPERMTQVLPPISFVIASTSPTVAPGGLLTYTFALTNFSASIAQHPVVVIEVPQNTRFAESYPTGKKSVPGVQFVTPANIAGTLYKDVFYAVSAQSEVQSQVVISFGSLAACPNAKGLNAVTFHVTFQAEWVDPAHVPAISTVNYLAAFLNTASYGNFSNAFSAAGITTATAGPNDFYMLISDSTGDIALSQNGSGEVSIPFKGSLIGQPLLHLQKMLSASANNVQDNGNGTSVDLVQPGQDITLMLSAYNDGANAADEVFIEDTMPQSCAYVSGSLLFNSTKSKSSPSTLASATTFTVVPDVDGQHLRFEGLYLAAGDYVSLQYTVRVFDGATNSSQPAPAPNAFIDPLVAIDPSTGLPAPASIGSSSTPQTWLGFYFSEPIQVIGAAQFAPLGIRTLFAHPAVSADVNVTSNALTAFYLKYPNSVPVTDAKNPLSFYPGVEQYYIHYQNDGAAVTGSSIDVPLPVGTVFLRAAFVKLPANTTAGTPVYFPGTIMPIPKGASIVPPSTPNGTVTFNLPPLSVATNGDVMVEVIIAPDAVQVNGSLLGDPNGSLVGIYDSTVTPAVRALARRQDDGNEPVLVSPHSSMAPFGSLPLTADFLVVPLSRIGLMKTVPQQVHPNDQFQETVVVYNYGDTDANPTTLLIIPDNTQFVSVDAGQSDAAWQLSFEYPNSAGAVVGILASGNGPVVGVVNPLKAHTAAAMTVTLLVTGAVGSTIVGASNWDGDPSNARLDMPYYGEADPASTTTSIVDPNTPLSTATSTVFTSVPLFNPVVSSQDITILDLGTNSAGIDNVVVEGPAAIVASGAGNIIGLNGSGIVASGAGNAIPIGTGTCADLLGQEDNIVKAQTGNFFAPKGSAVLAIQAANIVASGAGNIVGEHSSGIVASGAGNIVASGAGNIVASGAGNIVASGAGNLIAAGGAAIVASGVGNIVSTNGSNDEAEDANETSASNTGYIIASTPDSIAEVRTTAGNLYTIGGENFKPYHPFQ